MVFSKIFIVFGQIFIAVNNKKVSNNLRFSNLKNDTALWVYSRGGKISGWLSSTQPHNPSWWKLLLANIKAPSVQLNLAIIYSSSVCDFHSARYLPLLILVSELCVEVVTFFSWCISILVCITCCMICSILLRVVSPSRLVRDEQLPTLSWLSVRWTCRCK